MVSRLSKAVHLSHADFSDATNTTVTVVSGVSGKTTRVFVYKVGLNTAEAVTLKGGSQTLDPGDYGANSGIYGNLSPHYFELRADSSTLTGTVTTTATVATITGSGTAFTTDFGVGDTIKITGGDELKIASITSATVMTATASATTTVSGAAYVRRADDLDVVKTTAGTAAKGYVLYEQEVDHS